MTTARALSLAFVFTSLFASIGWSADGSEQAEDALIRPVGESDLSEFVWKKRPVVVFADSANDPAFIAQMELFDQRPDALVERDVVVLVDTDSSKLSPARKKLRPRGFMLVILSKEGRVQLRKPFPWDVREISRSIDKLPIRQREIRDAKSADR
jgi:hypothetical protein